MNSQTVVKKPDEPYIYLYINGEWYCYDPEQTPMGEGAMGVVYKGFRCSNSEMVAVKRVKDEFASNEMIRARAKQEATLNLSHPNLVEMVGYCEYAPDMGPIFIVSKLITGENADKYVLKWANKPDKVSKVCDIICSVLNALEYIHKQVVHRDIKPSNIMVESNGNARLMDLGISRLNGGNKYSMYGFIGTPDYSAPEQILREVDGVKSTINPATDIYALGITFYELLVGRNPMVSKSEVQTLGKQLKTPLPYDKSIPRALFKVISKATDKKQEKRYQTAAEFREAIKKALVANDKISWKVNSWIESHTILFLVIIAAVAVLIAILGVVLFIV